MDSNKKDANHRIIPNISRAVKLELVFEPMIIAGKAKNEALARP